MRTIVRFCNTCRHWVVSLVEVRDVFVSNFNSETGNRLDVPKSGLNWVLIFLLFFQIE